MNLIPYTYFIYINYLLFLGLLTLSWIISPSSVEINVFITVCTIIVLLALIFSKKKDFPKWQKMPTRIVQLIVFVVSIIVSFSHYFFNVDNTNLILIVLILPAISLLSLIIVNNEENVDKDFNS